MNKLKLAVSVYLAMFGLLVVSGADGATLNRDVAPDDKIAACVAGVAEKADYSDAVSVRHVVNSSLYLTNKHKLRIETQVLDETGETIIREYAAICIAPNGDRPVTVKVRERS